MTVLSRIAASAEIHAERPAIFAKGECHTYNELIAAARGIRACLVESGCISGSRVAVVTGDDFRTYASLLAIWSAGAAYVPLNVNNPVDRNEQILKDADSGLILTSRPQSEWGSHLPAGLGPDRIVQTTEIAPDEGPLPVPRVDPDDLAYLFFTSGSTGKPKGVPITHANLDAFMTVLLEELGYGCTAEDRFLQMFELTFDLSVMSVFAPWCIGASTHVVPEKGIAYMNIVDLLMKQRITVALMVPSLLPYLQRFFDEIRLPELRLSLFCGEALMHDIVAEWSQCVPNARIENVYGPTEATIFCTTYRWETGKSATEQVNGIVSIGRQMPGMQALVIGADEGICKDGEKGELCLIGAQVMSGYWQDEEKNKRAFVEVELSDAKHRAYRTGDVAFVNEFGNLVYCGRKDSQIKIDGHRIELGEIEHFARKFIGSSQAAIIVKSDVVGRDFLELFVAAVNLDREKLQAFLRSKLPEYMLPRQVRTLAELPLNLNGKIDRIALSKMDT